MAFFSTLITALGTVSKAVRNPDAAIDNALDALDSAEDNVRNNNFSSIAAKASEGILQFPVIISDSIDYETAVIITKALERNYATFMQTIISMNATTSDVNAHNISTYLRRFHDNGMSNTVDSDGRFGDDVSVGSMRAALTGSNESYNREHLISFKDPKNENVEFTCEFYNPGKVILNNVLKEELKYYLEAYCLEKLNDKFQPVKLENAGFTIPMFEAKNMTYNQLKKENEKLHKDNESLKGQLKDQKDRYTRDTNNLRNRFEVKHGKDVNLLPTDVRKANELQPTFIKVTIKRSDRETRTMVDYNIIIGIKATLHLAKSAEYVTNLVDACEYKGTLFRFIKWTTGEISFLRDYVLRMDEFSKETTGRVTNNSHWWEALKRRARDAKMSKVKTNRLLPNASFVFTVDEVEYIKANFGYDLLSSKMAKQLMKEYFLLGYVVLDMANEVAHIMYDGQKDFQLMTFRNLERESVNSERQFKDALKAMRQM